MRLVVVGILAALLSSASLYMRADHVHPQHGGGTDDMGCHTDRKTGMWHCH